MFVCLCAVLKADVADVSMLLLVGALSKLFVACIAVVLFSVLRNIDLCNMKGPGTGNTLGHESVFILFHKGT